MMATANGTPGTNCRSKGPMLARHISASERAGGNSLAEKIALVTIHSMLKAKIFHRKKILSFFDPVIS